MTNGRKLARRSVAAILAALFVVVAIGHSGAHLGAGPADPPCATCQTAAAPGEPVGADAAPLRFETPASARHDAPVPAGVSPAHPSRGPPALG